MRNIIYIFDIRDLNLQATCTHIMSINILKGLCCKKNKIIAVGICSEKPQEIEVRKLLLTFAER